MSVTDESYVDETRVWRTKLLTLSFCNIKLQYKSKSFVFALLYDF